MVTYSESFKARMVYRLLHESIRPTDLERETGVSRKSLSRWLAEARTVADMGGKSSSPRDRSAEEKLKLVVESLSLSDDELGEFLRRNGVHEAELRRWRIVLVTALDGGQDELSATPRQSGESKRVRELERSLAEVSALLDLAKKAQALWGEGGSETAPHSAV